MVSTEDCQLSDFCSDAVAKTSPIFSSYENLTIILYYDDLEVCNPLGSKKPKHKIGAFYFTLGNYPNRSRLEQIHLLALANTSLIKKYTVNAILKYIVNDVRKLEDGYRIKDNSIIKGSLACVSADNPAAALLGSFTMSLQANHPCRHCMVSREDINNMVLENTAILRNKSLHLAQCDELESSDSFYNEISKQYGVNFRSEVTKLRHFDVTQGIIFDIMHDLLEGVLPLEFKLLLNHLISKRVVSLQEVNNSIESLKLGYKEIKNKPSPIDKKHLKSENDVKFGQSATQMWLLCRLFPLLCGSKVPVTDKNWKNFLVLIKIIDYVFSPVLTEEDCVYLQLIIKEHHEGFRKIYPDNSFTLKMHNMLHMPRMMIEYGPLVRLWTMRFEAKHQYFKHTAQRLNNFINICKSLTTRHQLLQVYHQDFPSEEVDAKIDEDPISPEMLVQYNINIPSNDVLRCKWVKIASTLFKSPCIVLFKADDFPEFLNVEEILICERKIILAGTIYRTRYFSEHYHCIVLEDTGIKSHLFDLIESHPFPLHFKKFYHRWKE